jgi:membrane-associated protease RseP (regulator of RpoE activity)
VSSDFPDFSAASPQQELNQDTYVDEPPPTHRQWALSILLLFLTIITTTFAGMSQLFEVLGFKAFLYILARPSLLLNGILYSFPVIVILSAHELGHYLACRYYGMLCTPPYFIPVPISPTGTLGAFIKIKSRFLSRKSLFDIGIAGPLAGFFFILPALWIGISLSKIVPKGIVPRGNINFGEPIILRFFGKIILGYSPAYQDMLIHPLVMAAWVGLLATSLNLLPIWQLDGGHIAYAMIGRSWQKRLSIATLVALIFVSFAGWPTPSYLLFFVLLLIFGIRSRFYHPATLWDEEELGSGRIILGIIAFLILIVCFMPVPISIT